MARHTYRVGVLPWTLEVTGEAVRIGALWGTTEVPLAAVRSLGIACTRYDAGALGVPAPWQKKALRLRSGARDIALPPGPAGLVLVYEIAGGTKNVAVTFPSDDPAAVALVQAVLDAVGPEAFAGVGSTPEVRAAMGLGGGDFVAGVVLFVALGAVVALLMWLGVID